MEYETENKIKLQDIINDLPKSSELVKEVKQNIMCINKEIIMIEGKIKSNEEKINKIINMEKNLKLIDKDLIVKLNEYLNLN